MSYPNNSGSPKAPPATPKAAGANVKQGMAKTYGGKK